jgi:putative membrane protein
MNILFLIKTIHYLALVALLWASFSKNKLLMPSTLSIAQVQSVLRFDKLSAAAAGTMLLSGASMALWFAKPTAYYVSNPWFWFKLGIFFVASAMVIMSKLKLRAAARATDAKDWLVTNQVRWILRIDFVGIVVMLFLGVLIAKGHG